VAPEGFRPIDGNDDFLGSIRMRIRHGLTLFFFGLIVGVLRWLGVGAFVHLHPITVEVVALAAAFGLSYVVATILAHIVVDV